MLNRPLLTFALLASAGCQKPLGSAASGDVTEAEPFRSGWREECVHGMTLSQDADGRYTVSNIQIGGKGDKSFHNRGDVIVEYADDRDWMDVCARKFTYAASKDDAQDDFDKMSLWLGDEGATGSMLGGDARACEFNWHDGCGVRVHTPGRPHQALRSGADLRVTLPSDYFGKVTIFTEDLTQDDDYQNRGNVCVWDLPGSADIQLANGQALVRHADALRVAPTCSADDLMACDAMDWAADCPCLAKGHPLGFTTIASERAADMAVQTPAKTWTTLSADTVLFTGDADPQPCPIGVAIAGAELELNELGKMRGSVNAPEASTAGGYGIRAEPKDCGPRHFVEKPEDYVPGSQGEVDPRRGEVTICTDCVRNTSCEDFLDRGLRVQLPS